MDRREVYDRVRVGQTFTDIAKATALSFLIIGAVASIIICAFK